MIIINKKRLITVTGLLLIAIFAFTFQKADLNKTVQTVSLPVSNKVIVLDAGHRTEKMKERNHKMVRQKQTQI